MSVPASINESRAGVWFLSLCFVLSTYSVHSLCPRQHCPTEYDWDFRSASDFLRLTAPRPTVKNYTVVQPKNSTWLSTCNNKQNHNNNIRSMKTGTDSWSCQEPVSGVKFRILECVQVRVGHLHILPLYLYLYLYSVFCTGQTIYHINYHDTIPVSCQLPRSTFSRISGSTDKTARDYGVHYHTEYRTAQSTK